MLRLAANAVPALLTLLAEQPDFPIDYLHYPSPPRDPREVQRARALRPLLLHGWSPQNYSVTDPVLPQPEILREQVVSSGTPYLSVHLDLRLSPGQTPPTPEQVLEAVVRGARDLRRASGLDLLLLENVPFCGPQRPEWIADPAFIGEALAASDCGLLLDLAHARVTAWHLGEDLGRYLAAFPLGRVVEVHVSGTRLERGALRDRHAALLEGDYALLERILPRLPAARTLTLEYLGLCASSGPLAQRERRDLLEQLLRLDTLRRHLAGAPYRSPLVL
ncbi:hypothetical protein HNR42_001427 [Deinobacterium chartae]|uniref:DUF692 family protein n=1 Tax=Deinobacterium chartae TaxID=521158 RepID=A0A841HZB6_9DEIO|nr:DUF692 family multinuclear iron-containing protein [Deinobacterium chartae]MBB6098004.1 hypothetical protein [Deinobacterium chartae]